MGQALAFLFAVLMLGGGPVVDDPASDEPLQTDVETPVAEAHVGTGVSSGEASVGASPDHASEANDSASANASAGSPYVAVEAQPSEADASVAASPLEMHVRVSEGQLVELTYTPPAATEALDGVGTDHELVEAEDESEVEPASQAAPADTSDEETEVAWTIAPAAGIAAAAAAGHALPLGRWLRRLLGLAPAVPLFSRIEPDEMLEHEAREAIYEALDEQAGLSLEALCRELDLARSTARHHVRKLEQAGLIEHTRLGRARVHHLVGQRHRAIRQHLLTNDTRRSVYEAVEDEALTITEIAERLDANPGSVHFHLGKLADAGLVVTEGEQGRRYRAREPDAAEVTL